MSNEKNPQIPFFTMLKWDMLNNSFLGATETEIDEIQDLESFRTLCTETLEYLSCFADDDAIDKSVLQFFLSVYRFAKFPLPYFHPAALAHQIIAMGICNAFTSDDWPRDDDGNPRTDIITDELPSDDDALYEISLTTPDKFKSDFYGLIEAVKRCYES